MNTKFQIRLFIAIAAFCSATNSLPQSSNAQTPHMTDRINFYCGEFSDKSSGETIPATMAYVPQRKARVSIIAWKSNYIPAWDAQTRCDTVSPKFQTFFDAGRLDYLTTVTTGKNNTYPIICAVGKTGQPCKPEDQLFQVKANDKPQEVLKGLTGIIDGKTSEPLHQSSGSKVYVSMDKLLYAAPLVKETDSASN